MKAFVSKLPVARLLILLFGGVLVFLLKDGNIEQMPSTLSRGVGGLCLLVGAWLGVDFAAVTSASLALPAGESKKISECRYIFALAILGYIFYTLYGMENKTLADAAASTVLLTIGSILGLWVSARKSNNIVKNKTKKVLSDGK